MSDPTSKLPQEPLPKSFEEIPTLTAAGEPMSVPGYRILGLLGEGRLGTVYKAEQVQGRGLVALKLMKPGRLTSARERVSFKKVVEALSRLQHPNIVTVYEADAGGVGGRASVPFVSMELCPGGSLADQLGTPWPPQRAAALMEQVACAVQAAHEQNVVHRNLKPANILFTADGTPKVSDFGLTNENERERPLTQTGFLSTGSYTAPEQATGRSTEIEPSVDVYALGAILYEATTGHPPCKTAEAPEPLDLMQHQEHVPPRRLQAALPRDLEIICITCLNKDAHKRYPSAAALADDLHRFQAGAPVIARPAGALGRVLKWLGRRSAPAALTAVILAVLLLPAVGVYVIQQQRVRSERERVLEQQTIAEAQRLRAEQTVYSRQIALACEEWKTGHFLTARNLLEATQPALRGWEYDHLTHRFHHLGQRTLFGHTELVRSVAFSPDGTRLASASDDHTVKVWEARSSKEQFSLQGHTGWVTSVCFSPDGKQLASASADTTVRLWDATTGQQTHSLRGHTRTVKCVCFSPDGRRLASASDDETVRVWDTLTGRQLICFKRRSGGVSSVCFSPDGKRLASASYGHAVKVWDATTGQEHFSLHGHTDMVYSVCFSPDGTRLASGSYDKKVKVWDAQTGQELLTLQGHSSAVYSVSFSPDGTYLASGGGELYKPGEVKMWEARTGALRFSLQGATDEITSVVFSPDGTHLAAGSYDKTVKLWDASTGQEPLTLTGHTDSLNSVVFSPDGQRLATGSEDQTVKVWDAHSGQQLLELRGHTQGIRSVAFSPDGKRLASAGYDKMVKVWDAHSGQQLLSLTGHTASVFAVCFSPDGRRLASAAWDKAVKIWDAQTGRQLLSLSGHTFCIISMCFSPDGKRLASASWDGTVKVWDAHSGELQLSLLERTALFSSVNFSGDGKRLAAGTSKQTILVWDAQSGEQLLSLTGHSGDVTSVSFSPDGKRLVSASDDKTVKVWDATTGQEVLTLRGHTDQVSGACFSPDGRRLASASHDKTVKVWDAPPAQQTLALKGHVKVVRRVCFTPDGTQLTSTDAENKTVVWDVRTGKAIPSAPPQLGPDDRRSPDGRLFVHLEGPTIRLVPLERDWPLFQVEVDSGLRFHKTILQNSEQQGDWFVVAFHLGQLLKLYPWDAGLHVRRSYALAQLGHADRAAIEYLHALFLNPAAHRLPTDPQASRRGELAAQAKDWPKAAVAFASAVRQREASLEDWKRLLLARLAAHQIEAYGQARAKMLDRFGSSRDPNLLRGLLLLGRLGPCSKVDADRMVRIAERLVAGDRNGTTLTWLGSVLYRAGRHREANSTLEKALKTLDEGEDVESWLFLGLVLRQLGHIEKARESFARFEDRMKERHFDNWEERLHWHLLAQEARAPWMPRAAE